MSDEMDKQDRPQVLDFRKLRLQEMLDSFSISKLVLNHGGSASLAINAKVNGPGLPEGLSQANLTHIEGVDLVIRDFRNEPLKIQCKVGKVTLSTSGCSVSLSIPAIEGEFNAQFLAALAYWELLRSWQERIRGLCEEEVDELLENARKTGAKIPSLDWHYQWVQQELPLGAAPEQSEE